MTTGRINQVYIEACNVGIDTSVY